jgi:hypothetical protein
VTITHSADVIGWCNAAAITGRPMEIVLMPIGGQKAPRETPSIVRHFEDMI